MDVTDKILAVVLNWNKRDALARMLESLRVNTSVPFDTVVIDNASTDGSVEMLRERFPWVQIVQNEQNLGGTGGFNKGLRYGLSHPNQYDYLWLLDNDVYVHRGAMDGLLKAMNSDPKVGLAGSTIVFIDQPDFVQECGVRLLWQTGGPDRLYEGPLASLPPKLTHDVDYVAACSMLARTEAVRQVGLWDPAYFLMWDDMEWGVRFGRAGWRVVATAESVVGHEDFLARRAFASIASTYLWNRNAYYFLRRYCPLRHMFVAFYHRLRVELAMADNYEADGYPHEAKALRLAIADFFHDRFGAPPQDLFAMSPRPEPWRDLPERDRAGVRRIALFACEDGALTQSMHRRLCEQFPGAEVDTLVLDRREEEVRCEFSRMHLLHTDTLPRRVRIATYLAFRYDIAACLRNTPRRLFERFPRYNIRFEQDLTWQVKKRSISDLAGTIFRRLGITIRALCLAVRAVMKPRGHVDYYQFND